MSRRPDPRFDVVVPPMSPAAQLATLLRALAIIVIGVPLLVLFGVILFAMAGGFG